MWWKMTTKGSTEEIGEWLLAIDTANNLRGGLTKREEDFVESIREQMDERGYINERQRETLERIYRERA